MEILINELSLKGQFQSIKHFIDTALIPFVSVVNELDRTNDTILKRQNLWTFPITGKDKLHSLTSTTDIGIIENRVLKNLLRNLSEPYWEENQQHNTDDSYEFNGNNISGSSLAESCERDRIVISFIASDFSILKLKVSKKKKPVEVDNLFQKEHFIEVANSKGQIDKCEYFKRKFAFGLITLLENECRFIQTNDTRQGQRVYQEIKTNNYWYLDNLHKNHYEVFNHSRKYIGVADLQGNINPSERRNGRRF